MDIQSKLKRYNQEHLLEIIYKMDEQSQKEIINELQKLDLDEIEELYITLKNPKEKRYMIEPIGYIEKERLSKQELEEYKEIGLEIIENMQYAIITMAGGQGTRLGHNGPKGTFELNIEGKSKAIFEILSEQIKIVKDTLNVEIPWYIMTSSQNDKQTKVFFEDNNYFGLDKISFFLQEDIPVLDENGKLLIGEDYKIKKAGNGNGGIYKSLENNGILKDLDEKGIKWIFISGIDNILMQLVDPVFLGLNYKNGTEIASKSATKTSPEEKTGVFCKKDHNCGIIEYSEINDEIKNLKDEAGKLIYSQINILAHLFSLDALKKLKDIKLKYHLAHKKNIYIDENLNPVIPKSPNTYKFEKFIFDGFEQFKNMTLLNVSREKEFAPIKNSSGNDSPETAIKLYINEKRRGI